MTIAENLADILARIEAARKAAIKPAAADPPGGGVQDRGRKRASARRIAAGQRLFGENRVQEAQGKFPALKQRISRSGIAPDRAAADQQGEGSGGAVRCDPDPGPPQAGRRPGGRSATKAANAPRLFLQVNTGEEPQKAGVLPRETAALIAHARKLELPLEGLMCIPPVDDDAAPHFAFLAKLARDHGLAHLSMGMSGDFELAVKFGATHVRVGTAHLRRGRIVYRMLASKHQDLRSRPDRPAAAVPSPPAHRHRPAPHSHGWGNNPACARCRKMALPLPGTTGSSL